MTTDSRISATLLSLLLLGVGLSLAGVGRPRPFDRVQALVPPSLQRPLVYVGLGLVGLVLSALALLVVAKVVTFAFRLLTRGGEAVSALPDVDPLFGGMVAFVVLVAVFLGGATLAGERPAEATGNLPFVSEAFGDGGTSVHGIVASDELGGVTVANASLPEYADADGDRLPDAWERANETPDGTPLPRADPRHKDLYVNVEYARDVEPLNASEKRQLRRIWAGMPVRNPDGETGIRLHLDDAPPRGGPIDESVSIDDSLDRGFLETHYGRAPAGNRSCTRYLVIFGRVTSRYDGVGMVPGYLSVVDGTVRESREGYPARVAIFTHELLHNTVGTLEGGRTHVPRGWLHGFGGEFQPTMSDPVREELNRHGFARSPFFEHELCEEPVGGRSRGASRQNVANQFPRTR